MQDVAQQAEKAKTFTPGAPAAEEQKLTDEHRAIYADRIAKATTVEEVRCLFFVGRGGGCVVGTGRPLLRCSLFVVSLPGDDLAVCLACMKK